MRKEDMTIGNLICEAVGIVATLIYMGLQIYCGMIYRVPVLGTAVNILMVLLVYAGLVMLVLYPEKVNGLERETCTGKVRQLTIHMLLNIKLVFVISLLFTSICDVMGKDVDGVYSLLTTGLIIILAAGYEFKIYQILKNTK